MATVGVRGLITQLTDHHVDRIYSPDIDGPKHKWTKKQEQSMIFEKVHIMQKNNQRKSKELLFIRFESVIG